MQQKRGMNHFTVSVMHSKCVKAAKKRSFEKSVIIFLSFR